MTGPLPWPAFVGDSPLRRDLAPIRLTLEVARRMDVVMVDGQEFEEDEAILLTGGSWRPRKHNMPNGFDPDHLSNGPVGWTWAGHGIVVSEPPFKFSVHGADDWLYVLHEVSHAVWTPPGEKPDAFTSECVGQDQWEKAVVLSSFPRRYWKTHREFQDESSRPRGRKDEFGMRKVADQGEYKDSRRLASWREGRQLAIAVGALDDRGRPTWRRPDYGRLREFGGGLQ